MTPSFEPISRTIRICLILFFMGTGIALILIIPNILLYNDNQLLKNCEGKKVCVGRI